MGIFSEEMTYPHFPSRQLPKIIQKGHTLIIRTIGYSIQIPNMEKRDPCILSHVPIIQNLSLLIGQNTFPVSGTLTFQTLSTDYKDSSSPFFSKDLTYEPKNSLIFY